MARVTRRPVTSRQQILDRARSISTGMSPTRCALCDDARPCATLRERGHLVVHFQAAGSHVAWSPPASTGSRNPWAAFVTSSSVAQTNRSSRAIAV